ncbi:MAG: ABC transporter substrate-binding protein [Nitriliruptorales bacterium]|nr:ABC transporter substrate-binding protein [Nitriliruptorales bacterium]
MAAALALSACGPRFDRDLLADEQRIVIEGGNGGQVVGDAPTTGVAGPGATDPSPGATDPGVAGPAAPGPAAPGGPSGPGSNPTTGPGPGPTSGPAGPVEAGPAPGVTDTTIKIGVLVPLSGAAGAIPPTWRNGIELYWDELAEQGGIFGRNVELVIEDTESNVSTATAKAVKLVDQDKVFTIFTLDRLEVHDAVGKRLEAVGMPNVMMQLPAPIPADWKHSFGISMDHQTQGRAIARFFKGRLNVSKVGFVREQTSALKPGTDAFEAEAATQGLDVVADETIDPNAGQYANTVNAICSSGAEAVWLYMAPIPARAIMQQTTLCNPTWFANSVSWNFDIAVAGETDPAMAFSPWAAYSSNRSQAFRQAWANEYGSEPEDDIGYVGWAVDTVLHAMLENAGANLGWNTFEHGIRTLRRAGDAEWTPLDFTGGGINGSNQAALFQLGGGAWQMQGDFAAW